MNLKERLGYSLGDLGIAVLMSLIGPYLLLFYTDNVGIEPALASIMLSISMFISNCFNPIAGVLIDKTSTKYGKCKPYIMIGGVATAIFCIACFFNPNISNIGKIIYIFITYTLMNVSRYFFIDAYGALSANMTQDPKKRGELSLLRMIGASVGGTIIAILIPKMLKNFGGGDSSYTFTMVILAGFAMILFFILTISTKERYFIECQKEVRKKIGLKSCFEVLIKNKPLLIFSIYMFLQTGVGMESGLSISYYFKYVLNDMNTFALINSLKSIMMLLGLCSMPILMKNFDKKFLMIISTIGSMIAPIAYCFTTTKTIPYLVAAIMITSLFSSVAAGLMWGIVADTVEWGELHLGKRTEGINFAMVNFMNTIGSSLFQIFPGLIMSFTGYDAMLSIQSHKTLQGIRFCNGGLPIVLYTLSLIAILAYPLSDKKSSQMIQKLQMEEN